MSCRYDARSLPARRPADTHRLTQKQYLILTMICDGVIDTAGARRPLDIDQLLERLPYRTTKASIQFSLRSLEARRLITREYEKRRDRLHSLILPTKLALVALTSQFDRPSPTELAR